MLLDRILDHIPFFRNKRKADFIGKLKDANYGKHGIRFRDHSAIPVGGFLAISDYQDHKHVFLLVAPNKWHVTSTKASSRSPALYLEVHQVEEYITNLYIDALKKKKYEYILISDEFQYLELDYNKASSAYGLHKFSHKDFPKDI